MNARPLTLLPAAAIVLLLGACSWLPNTETPAQNLAVVDAQFTALVETATDMRAAGGLTDAQAARLTPIILRGNAALNAAWSALLAGNGNETERYIRIALALLVQLRDIVQSNQFGGAP